MQIYGQWVCMTCGESGKIYDNSWPDKHCEETGHSHFEMKK